jgi:cob(I)alamin adenosyltransferase
MKIYTKTGDTGTTGLFAGPRVWKDHPRIVAYGAVDELNAVLGVLVANSQAKQRVLGETLGTLEDFIQGVQSDLFSIGAELATPDPEKQGMCLLTADRISYLEQSIDCVEAALEPLTNFVLPCGSCDATQLHLARTVCRRAEREIVHLSQSEGVHDCTRIIVYLNRLSDLFFVMARQANQQSGVADVPWKRPVENSP